HEDVVGALAVEELHLAFVDDRERDLLVGAERPVEHRAAARVLELRAHECATFPRLHVLELDDRHQALGQVERHAVLQVVGRDAHGFLSRLATFAHRMRSLPVRVRGSAPVAPTTTVSSMRTPPMPGRYTPGSTVTTSPTSNVSSAVDATRGASWISRPTPWPVECENASAHPASAITSREARSMSAQRTSAAPIARPAWWVWSTTSYTRRASGPGSPTDTVRVMSEQYPSTMQPKSHTIISLCSMRRTLGMWCGFAPFGPDAMIGSKLFPLAPRSRIANSSSSAKARSLRPSARRGSSD